MRPSFSQLFPQRESTKIKYVVHVRKEATPDTFLMIMLIALIRRLLPSAQLQVDAKEKDKGLLSSLCTYICLVIGLLRDGVLQSSMLPAFGESDPEGHVM
jgi:hypothetical protein